MAAIPTLLARPPGAATARPTVPAVAATVAAPVLDVSQLHVRLDSGADVVAGVSFSAQAGQVIGLVGESGSGKSTVAAALLGHARHGARISGGQVRIAGIDLLALDATALRAVRGRVVAHVAQDPGGSLDPLARIGSHLHEALAVHDPDLPRRARDARIAAVLADVDLPTEPAFLKRFPHQLSGGQQQRVALALAFVLQPRLIVLDEPTTALDVSTQARVLATVRTLCRRRGVAAVYVSHDLAVVRSLADRVLVLYAGRVVEEAPLQRLFDAPSHPYTQGLLAAIPDVARRRELQPIPGQAPLPGARAAGCAFAPRCPVRAAACSEAQPGLQAPDALHDTHRVACLRPTDGPAFAAVQASGRDASADDHAPTLLSVRDLSAWYGPQRVLQGVSFDVRAGRCLAIVGESGSGKTTLARAIVGLGHEVSGHLDYDNWALPLPAAQRPADARRDLQFVFQNPYRSLNPRHTVGDTLATAARHFFGTGPAEARQRAAAVLAQVALPPELLAAYPRELSGGERQRVAIARALVGRPRLLVCDEITSALDVSVQAAILALLRGLQRDGLSLLFVTHDVGVVRAIADHVLVLRQGRTVEQGPVDRLLDAPADDYTRRLLADSPSLHPALAPVATAAA